MTFDQLMQRAEDIAIKAGEVANRNTPDNRGNSDEKDLAQQYKPIVHEVFEPFSQVPDPEAYNPLIQSLRDTKKHLSPGALDDDPLNGGALPANPALDGTMNSARRYLLGWTGQGAESFMENFIDPFDSYTANQFIAVSAMQGALEAHQAMWTNVRKNISGIADDTLTALDNVYPACGKNGVDFTLTVLSAVAAIGVTAATGGTAAVVSLSLIGAATTMGSAATKLGDIETLNGGGGSADAVLESMKKAAGRLEGQIQETEQEIEKNLDQISGMVKSDKRKFVAPTPALATMSNGKLTGDDGLGNSV